VARARARARRGTRARARRRDDAAHVGARLATRAAGARARGAPALLAVVCRRRRDDGRARDRVGRVVAAQARGAARPTTAPAAEMHYGPAAEGTVRTGAGERLHLALAGGTEARLESSTVMH